MKRLSIILSCILGLATLFGGCEKEKLPGSVYGVVTDKATGDPIINAGVELQPVGLKTVTGSDGRFEFNEVEVGTYNVYVSKTGYISLKSADVEVKEGKQTQYDVQMEKLPASLRVVDNNNNDIDSLDFGNQTSDVARSFNIFNDGSESIEWEITKTANWISGLSKESGTLSPGATQAVIVTIDRSLLQSGENTTTLHITSNNGSKQLTVIAVNGTVLPTLNTLNVTNIYTTSATLNGKILTAGTPSYTERGFVYSTSSTPTVENAIAQLTSPVTTSPDFSATATGLTTGATYYVRAYAINEAGTAYSTNVVNFQPQMSLPTVSTSAATNIHIGAGTATFNGTIVNAGDPAYTERGFVYGIMHNPTIDDTKRTVSGNGTGAYYANVTNLVAGTTYYIRAYATNQQGTAYGEEVTMAFNPVMPELTTSAATNLSISNQTATFNGTITNAGDPAYTERGFVYGYMHNPTIEDDSKKVSPGNGAGAFSVNATGLEVGRTYYIRAYATSAFGTSYGNEVALDFSAILPTVTTLAVSDNVNGGATFNGNITNVGDPAYTERGFVYGTMSSPTIDDATVSVVSGTALGTYTKTVSNLNNGATYYVRAYAKNASNQVAYGTVVSFVVRPVYLLRGGGPGGIDLYVSRSDEGSFAWSTQNITTGANNPSDGSANMEVIRAIDPDLSDYPAFKACSDMGSGWYLPSKDELNRLYSNKAAIGGFSDVGYWSSTECIARYAWEQDFDGGYQNSDHYYKSSTYRVRCVRRVN